MITARTSESAVPPPTTTLAKDAPTPPLAMAVTLGELVPVGPAPITADAYVRACTLATSAGLHAGKLGSSIGPGAEARGFDAWLARESVGSTGVRIGSGIVGLVATFVGGCAYGLDGLTEGAYAAGLGVGLMVLSLWANGAADRVARAVAKARERRVEASQLDALLEPFAEASTEVRAIAADAVRERVSGIDSILSAKAATNRDRVLDVKPTSAEAGRGRQLTVALARLLCPDGPRLPVRHSVDAIIKCLGEAGPAERREMAVAIERCTFDKEQPLFVVRHELNHERRLYRAIRAAEKGDAPSD